ncbi:hypothetical protein ABIB17_003637 [Arthrobacter sp. UYEF6]
MFWRKRVAVASSILVAFASLLRQRQAPQRRSRRPWTPTYRRTEATTNFGASVRLSTEGRANHWRNTLLRFIVQVPASEHVVSAKLRAYRRHPQLPLSSRMFTLRLAAGPRRELPVITHQHAGRGGGRLAGSLPALGLNGMLPKGVSAMGGEQNFMLESNARKWIGFKSKESSNSALRPRLAVTTAPDTVTPTEAAVVHGWGTRGTGDEFN